MNKNLWVVFLLVVSIPAIAGDPLDWQLARRTMTDMRFIATALESYAVDNNRYPDPSQLKSLSPAYIKKLPVNDAWATPFNIEISDDRQHYRIIAAGSDRAFQPDTWSTSGKFLDTKQDCILTSGGTGFTREWQEPAFNKDEFVAALRTYLNGKPANTLEEEKKAVLALIGPIARPGMEDLCKEQIKVVSALLKTQPDNARAYFMLSVFQAGAGNETTSEEGVRKAAELSPVFREYLAEMERAVELGKPKRTMADMRAFGTALEAHAVDNNFYPQSSTGDTQPIISSLQPTYIKTLPLKDVWGNPFRYYCLSKEPTASYWIISYGSDGKPQEGLYGKNGIPISQDSTADGTLGADIIFSSGQFLRYPGETQP